MLGLVTGAPLQSPFGNQLGFDFAGRRRGWEATSEQRMKTILSTFVHPAVAYPASKADFRRGLAAGFFAAASLGGFLPAIGISISFWPAAALRASLAGFFGASVAAAPPPMLLRSAYGLPLAN